MNNAEAVNSGFIEKLSSEGREKTAAQTVPFIKDRLREASFLDMIIPNQRVTRADLQVSTDHDTLVKIEEIEPGSRAMSLTFRGQPESQYVSAKRFAIAFWTISSLKWEMTEQELMAYKLPVTKLIEQNSLKDMVEVKDREGLSHIDACIEAMQTEGMGSAVAFSAANVISGTVKGFSKLKGALALLEGGVSFVSKPIQSADVVKIKKLLKQVVLDSSGNMIRKGRLRPALMLMTESDADDFDTWTIEDLGDALRGETVKEGYTYTKVHGLRIIRTIKTDILRDGNVYVFTAPEFFGYNYTLNDVKFYVDKVFNKIFWAMWMDIGMGFGNIASVVKLELYAGSVTPTATSSGYAERVSVAETSLGSVNNFVEEGLTYPRVVIS